MDNMVIHPILELTKEEEHSVTDHTEDTEDTDDNAYITTTVKHTFTYILSNNSNANDPVMKMGDVVINFEEKKFKTFTHPFSNGMNEFARKSFELIEKEIKSIEKDFS